MRSIIDYETAELSAIREAIAAGRHEPLVELFVDYLNFFEFIASLWKLGQLSETEIAMLFEYYLDNLGEHDFILSFITDEGFENLSGLRVALKKRKA